MAEFKRLKESRSALAVIQVLGNVTSSEVFNFLNSSMAGDSSLTLFDFRWASLSSISRSEIKSQIRTASRFSKPGIKTAFVFSNPADFSIGRLISKRTSKAGFESQTRGFYNPYLAKDWLLF